MLLKDQIRYRRESLGISMKELADRVGITEQAVRHWESGRSFPGKKIMHKVEQALSFTIDWTEGANPGVAGKTAAAMIDQTDVELLLVICKLPLKAKNLIADFARLHLEAVEAARSNGVTRGELQLAGEHAAPAPAAAPASATKTTRGAAKNATAKH